jgi:hypothetical protein
VVNKKQSIVLLDKVITSDMSCLNQYNASSYSSPCVKIFKRNSDVKLADTMMLEEGWEWRNSNAALKLIFVTCQVLLGVGTRTSAHVIQSYIC